MVKPKPPVGDLWAGGEASEAFRQGSLWSEEGAGKPVRIAFRNISPVPLLLCWVSQHGDLKHFYRLEPSSSILETDLVNIQDHFETTVGGHAFCWLYLPEDKLDEVRKAKSLDDTSAIMGGYRAFQECEGGDGDMPVHLVTISRRRKVEEICCQPILGNLRKRKLARLKEEDEEDDEFLTKEDWLVRAKVAEVDPTPLDTTTKVYERKILGGWPVCLEPNWHDGDKKLEKQLAEDLKDAAKLLPDHAREYLRTNCPIWVNASIQFGPKVCPVRGRGCCYHPDKKWLVENGMNEDKHMCVEINDGPHYGKDINLWGPGGVMVHELSHAYHHGMLPRGYDNKEIKECFEAAMKEGLYECVKVHGTQGPEAKAYASSNCMEYFAELSAAFLGGTDETIEYNKWYPFNRKQIQEHDPRAYELLKRVWRIECA
jgi:hypothetical protein